MRKKYQWRITKYPDFIKMLNATYGTLEIPTGTKPE